MVGDRDGVSEGTLVGLDGDDDGGIDGRAVGGSWAVGRAVGLLYSSMAMRPC